MTTNPTDPNKVLLTGENSFIRLAAEEGGTQTTRISHWRILYSPGGAGHVLFLKSDLVDDEVRIYSDNIAMTRYLQSTIESVLFPEFADQDTPVIQAEFDKTGGINSFWTESIESDEDNLFVGPALDESRQDPTVNSFHDVGTEHRVDGT